MRLLTVTAFVLALSLFTASASAATPFVGWKRNDAWAQEPRSLAITVDPEGFAFESERIEGGDDVLVGRYSLQGAEFRLDLRNQSGEGGVQSLRVAFSRLIEFRDADADGSYEATDATIRAWEVDDALAPTLEHLPRRDGTHEVVATYQLGSHTPGEDPGPTVALRFYLSPHIQSYAGRPMLPTETKFDVEVTGVPYNTSQTQVAAEFQMVAEEPTGLEGSSLATQSGEHRFTFAWQPTAAVDGIARNVGVNVVPASATTSGVYFSYARGARIVHDPSVSAHHYEPMALQQLSEALAKGSPFLYLAGFLVAAAAVGGMTYWRGRRQA